VVVLISVAAPISVVALILVVGPTGEACLMQPGRIEHRHGVQRSGALAHVLLIAASP
jgi:hypothetical protein